MSAFFEMMIALLPPNSSKARPNREATAVPTALPIRVEPVAEIRGILFIISHPFTGFPMTYQ
jgi:hypothetical protein